jgi:hypothetical protein
MEGLWQRLEGTDKDILVLRGEPLPPKRGKVAPPKKQDVTPPRSAVGAEQRQRRRPSGIIGRLLSIVEGPSPWSVEERDKAAKLTEAEWRQAQLGLAAGQLIAFANQKLMEHKFGKLKMAVRFGGIAVAIGVGAFAVAPKFSTETPLPITRPTGVTVHISSNNFGSGCPSGMVLEGVAVGGTWEKPVVITEAKGTCEARQVTLSPGQAVAVPQVSESPSPTPS